MRSHLLLITAIAFTAISPAEEFDEGRLELEPLVTDARDAIQLQVSQAGEVYFIERAGSLRCWSPRTRATTTIGKVPTDVFAEGGLTGLVLAPDFATSRQLYLIYSRKSPQQVMRLVRMGLVDGRLDPASERVVMEHPIDVGHCGGGVQIDAGGDLWWCIGDSTMFHITPATDERPGRETYDALRTSANSQDLRGKIVRIHPEADGTYSIPDGNLFADAAHGRREIYAMGCRNPYRLFFDRPNGVLYWGEVGSNTEERFGTGGFDEINRTSSPGFFGWPMFIGANTAYRRYDRVAERIGEPYDPAAPRNESRNNTGLKELPPARPAWIWYPSEDSPEFPDLGSGGRAAMVGPVYHYDPALASEVKLPQALDGRLFIYDWCRNWIKAVGITAGGGVGGFQPILSGILLRRPIDLKPGPEGTLYLLEYGEQGGGNQDGRISRLVYRRGNRAPVARIEAPSLAGGAPFTTRLSAASSRDPDGDALSYRWSFSDGSPVQEGREATWTCSTTGQFLATLAVSDPSGLGHSTTVRISVGNSVPVLRFTSPKHGFFDWGEKLPYQVEVDDVEDGGTAGGRIPGSAIRVRWQYQDLQAVIRGVDELGSDGAAGLMRRSDCLSCHTLGTASIGPSFRQIAERYRGDAAARGNLANKIISGGAGVWGPVPMAAHPQHTAEQAAAMAEFILQLQPPGGKLLETGASGTLAAPVIPERKAGGRLVLRAAYTDHGAKAMPPQTGEATVVLHARRTRAVLFDDSRGATVVEVATLRRSRRLCVQLGVGSHLRFAAVDLAGIAQVACEVSASVGHGGVLELRAGRVDGPLIGRVDIPVTGQWDEWRTVSLPVIDPGGVHDLYVVGGAVAAGERKRFNLDVLEFVPAPETR
jgi:cytochrome c